MKLTEKNIAGLVCEPGRKDRLFFDDDLPGLGVRVTAGGSKTFIVQYSAGNTKRRVPLGRWGAVALADARKAARAILGEVAGGGDPAAERRAKREEEEAKAASERYTLGVLIEEWEALALAGRSESYRAEALRAIRVAFSEHLKKPAGTLTRAATLKVLDGLAKEGKAAMAGRTLAYGRACYGWALKRGRVAGNPFQGLPIPTTTPSRERVLTDDEVGAIYAGAGTLGWPFGPLLRVLLLTAQRRSEVAGMRWSEITPDLSTWTLPGERAKNGQSHVVHLSAPVREILAQVPRTAGQDLVWSTTGTTPPSGFSAATVRLRAAGDAERAARAEAAGEDPPGPMPEWRLHDFRRACVTWLAGAGYNPAVADKLLNHVATTGLSDVARVYQRGQFLPERKAALEAWGAHVLAVSSGRTIPGNVVPLRAEG
ncbi:tyrosine-type recombinase/integrase [Pararhodospirillum oryzae]|uniref:Integrase n=1 Tax=Pararhodospirillum oryzae TaxID=478448 RepID=A0A512H994_9PROT|nr:site-specific integrase [Pararhodospirillum oryzae]GEO82014.1 integrase [Pararhodospirillum oryzae]